MNGKYKCTVCGGTLLQVKESDALISNPPKYQYECSACGKLTYTSVPDIVTKEPIQPTQEQIIRASKEFNDLLHDALRSICLTYDLFESKGMQELPLFEVGKRITKILEGSKWAEQYELRCKMIRE